MTINTIKALLIINAKKGWSPEARAKAAQVRKAKKGMKIGKAYFIRAMAEGHYYHDTDAGEKGNSAKSPTSHFGEARGTKRIYLGEPVKKGKK